MTRTISNSDDVIDSRDVIERIEELETEREELAEALSEAVEAEADARADDTDGQAFLDICTTTQAAREALAEWDGDNGDELKELKALADEAEGYADDWKYGAALIRESYFVDYCQELCEDIGDIPREMPSYIEIDWEATSRNLRVDYTEVEFGGVTYLVR